MNRIIKFRGLAVSSGEMVYGCLIKKRYNALADWMIEDENGLGSDVVTESIGQFTGLFDKNGKEIYDGDIIDFAYNNFVIEFADARFKSLLIGRTDDTQILGSKIWIGSEVIGNIHQNKELLNAPN